MRGVYFLLFSLINLVFWTACAGDDDTADGGLSVDAFSYTPLQVGTERIYAVDSIIYDPQAGGVQIDSLRSYLRERIVEVFEQVDSQLTYRIQRDFLKQLSDPWQPLDVISEWQTANRFIRQERNLVFTKLPRFVESGQSWNGHASIDPAITVTIAGETIEPFKNWTFSIEAIVDSYTLNNTPYEDCIITKSGSENLIELRSETEIYAKDRGLIYRELVIFDTQNVDASIPWRERAEKGFLLRLERLEN